MTLSEYFEKRFRRQHGGLLDVDGTGVVGESGDRESLVGTDAFTGALTRGSIGTIRETIKIENTPRYREVLWLGDLDSNQD